MNLAVSQVQLRTLVKVEVIRSSNSLSIEVWVSISSKKKITNQILLDNGHYSKVLQKISKLLMDSHTKVSQVGGKNQRIIKKSCLFLRSWSTETTKLLQILVLIAVPHLNSHLKKRFYCYHSSLLELLILLKLKKKRYP